MGTAFTTAMVLDGLLLAACLRASADASPY
jgi:hypothetical protein